MKEIGDANLKSTHPNGGGDNDNDDVNDDALVNLPNFQVIIVGDVDHHDLYGDVPSKAIHIQEHTTFNVQYSTESE